MLRQLDGDVHIESIEKLSTEERVYNLEIQGEHVFHVAASGVLVHNSSGVAPAHAFHRLEHRSLQRQGDISSLAADMKANGWKGDPIAVFEHGVEKFILDGHHRVAAARQAGINAPYRKISECDLPKFNYKDIDDVLRAASEAFGR